MTEYLDLIAGLIASLAMLSIVGGYAIVQQRRHLDARLQTYLAGGALVVGSPTSQMVMPVRPRPSVRLIGINQLQLVQAGMTITVRKFLVIQLILIIFGLALSWTFGRSLGTWLVPVLAAAVVVGLAIPRLAVGFKRRRRLIKFESQLANALDALASAVAVGLSVSQAFENISRDMPAPLGPEFGQVLRAVGMGIPLSEALDQLADRVPTKDVEIFAAALSIQYRTGGAISPVLRKIADTVRERIKLRAEIGALTAQARYSSYLLAALPILLTIVIRFVSPTYFALIVQPGIMRIVLGASLVGIVVGLFFMLRIADVEV